jgi:hypothetical protein
MPKYMLCGYCPSKVRMDPEGPVLPSTRGDIPYSQHALQHEAFGPTIDDGFVTLPKGEYRPPRPWPGYSKLNRESDAMFQEDRGWD